ncbi:MAG: ATP-dependent zinc metalloprotease FtsH [Acidimicrobiales bacterium]|nr:ATP-dependent zinc metalloprotease FtsH [Acidimicrobiales bacterium]
MFTVVGLVVLVWFIWLGGQDSSTTETLDFTAFLTKVDAEAVASVTIDPEGRIEGELSDGTEFRTQVPTAAPPQDLVQRLADHDVTVTASAPSGGWLTLVAGFLPVVLLIGFFVWMMRRAGGGGGAGSAFGGFGRSKAKLLDSEKPQSTFADVAGYDGAKAELLEVVDYLRRPERYHKAGAVGPGGVLMVGPPGTGKTLIARAVAGEAAVPFFSVSGSSFVELFVGVGAARVRDLFAQAREKAPAIIFIDEIDAIGPRRGGRAMIANDEREQTLDQLLAEMDGFDPATGVVVLAATNRPDVLDPALLRPGRFDRQVVIPLPNQAERLAILRVHCRSKQLEPDVDLVKVARSTPGFSGADLANLANEAAIVAVRDDRSVLTAADFDAARDRIILGRREKGTVLLADERARVAAHEAGHALVAALSDRADPVEKVSILPSGQALGVTHQLPVDERHLYTRSWFDDFLAVRLAGRAAEQLLFGEGSSGAADDLATATNVATRMVTDYGLSVELGPVSYADTRGYVEGAPGGIPLSGGTQERVENLVAELLRTAERRAGELLASHREALDALIARLSDIEVVDGSEVYALLGHPVADGGAADGPRPEPRPSVPVAGGFE